MRKIHRIGIHVIVVNVIQVGTVLFEQDWQVCVVAYQMFRYHRIRLTEIEAVDVRVATHREVFSHRILLVTCHVIKDKNRIWARLARWNIVAIVGERKVADFIEIYIYIYIYTDNVNKFFRDINTLVAAIRINVRTRSRNICRLDSQANLEC